MHALYAHVPELVKLYQNLAYYTQQGMEKNDTVSNDYFRSSNHSGISALEQLFFKNRDGGAGGLQGLLPPPPTFFQM